MPSDPRPLSPVAGLLDSASVAERLRVSSATIRSWRARKASWFPEPVGTLNGGLVWRASDIDTLLAEGSESWTHLWAARRRQSGSYYTPVDAAHYLASWVCAGAPGRILEPSFGDGSFIRAVLDVANEREMERPEWVAAEIERTVAEAAVSTGLITAGELRNTDFLALKPEPVDAVIANPPFVRLRHLTEDGRHEAMLSFQKATGYAMSSAGSLWLPFIAHAMRFLRDGGRAAFVLPLDFTYVSYARRFWSTIADAFEAIKIVRVKKRVFSGINQDVLLLLAEGFGGKAESLSFEAYQEWSDVIDGNPSASSEIELSDLLRGDRAFQLALLPATVKANILRLTEETSPVSTFARFHIGYVAGDKNFFHPSASTIEEVGIPQQSLVKTVVNARKIRGAPVVTSELDPTAIDYLWYPPERAEASGDARYIKQGEEHHVHEGYKASRRNPWYVVDVPKTPDLLLTVFSDTPALMINDAALAASNSLLCGYLLRDDARDFVARWYNPFTLLEIELKAHSLGGGVFVLVPGEANSLRLLKDVVVTDERLSAISAALSESRVSDAYSSGRNDLVARFGESVAESVEQATNILRSWRVRS